MFCRALVEFIEGIKFAELELRGVDDLVVVGTAGGAFYVDGADKKIERSSEGQSHLRLPEGVASA